MVARVKFHVETSCLKTGGRGGGGQSREGVQGVGSCKRRRGWETWKWQADSDRWQLGSRSRLGDKESLKIYCMYMDRKKKRVHWEQRGRCVHTVNLWRCHISGCFCILIAVSLAAAFWPPATFLSISLPTSNTTFTSQD